MSYFSFSLSISVEMYAVFVRTFYKKIQQACKPGYVLSKECLSFISTLCHHKALAVYPPASGEQPYNAGIHNLTTHKTYGILHYCKTR